jgi:hypothetical protein
VVVDPNGTAVVAWYEYGEAGEGQSLEVDTRQGESWHGPERISHEAGVQGYEHPALTTDGHGNFIAIWAATNDQYTVFSVVADEMHDGVWQGDQTLMSGDEQLGEANIAENATGEATALWMNYGLKNLDTATLRGGQWNVRVIESGSEDNQCHLPQPQVGVDAAGDSTAAWLNTAGDVLPIRFPTAAHGRGSTSSPISLKAPSHRR